MGEHFLFNEDLISWSVSWQEIIAADPSQRFHAAFADPPYLIKFMGKSWDSSNDPIATAEIWGQAILPLLFPGAIVLMFAGTRGWHWLAVGMEKAGFELWDTCLYLYGSGFPKGQDISKLIDKNTGTEKVVGTKPDRWTGKGTSLNFANDRLQTECKVTEPGSELSASWSGHKTPALKPAYEPVLCFRAPSGGKTYAELAMEYGSGAINVDGCRIGVEERTYGGMSQASKGTGVFRDDNWDAKDISVTVSGRYPANLILDEEAGQQLDQMVGTTKSGKMKAGTKRKNRSGWAGDMPEETGAETIGDSGGPSRYFYCAKASRSERNQGCKGVITWENVDLSQEMENLDQLARDTSDDTMHPLEDTEWSTILCGKNVGEKSQTDTKFTIETVSRLITALRTSNSYPHSNIKGFTLAAIRTFSEGGLNLAESVESISTLMKHTTNANLLSALGVVRAVLETLSRIREKGRLGNIHSTIKPLSLCKYLATLILPPDCVQPRRLLVPFVGTGSEMIGALQAGWDEVYGIEREQEYTEIAEHRIEHWSNKLKE